MRRCIIESKFHTINWFCVFSIVYRIAETKSEAYRERGTIQEEIMKNKQIKSVVILFACIHTIIYMQ